MLSLLPALALGLTLTGSPEATEVARIRRHFDGAIEMLSQRDISRLTPEQRARRAALTDVLRAYRDRGLFPRNYDFSAPTPYFIDRKTGVVCAVGHLMSSAGARPLVEAVAAANNNVWVAGLAGHAEFRDWLDENGLTLAEAARIQVPYFGEPEPPVRTSLSTNPSLGVSFLASAATVGLVQFVPQLKATRVGAVLAFAAGTFATTTAASSFNGDNDRSVVALTLTSGLLNLYVAGRTVGRYRAASQARRATVAPLIPTGRDQGTGVMLSFTF